MRITKKTLQRQQQHLRRHYPDNVAAIMRIMACMLVCLCLLVQGLLLLRIILSNEEPATAEADVITAAKTATNNRTSTTSTTTNSDFAYAWLLSGIDPKKPQLYRGMLYTVVLAMTQLRASNSQADFVVLVQCKKVAKDCLPETEVRWLTQASASHIVYLPPMPHYASFYQVQYSKFWVFRLTEYRKVLYMDADILPLCGHLDALVLDYSTASVVLAWKQEPATGGLFVVAPSLHTYDDLQEWIAHTEIKVAQKGDWDELVGWGHAFWIPGPSQKEEEDAWKSLSEWPSSDPDEYQPITHGTRWNWPGAYADQGLLYYFAKYYYPSSEDEGGSSSVSVINIDHVEEWQQGTLRHVSHPPVHATRTCQMDSPILVDHLFDTFPYSHFVHFTSDTKPWLHPPSPKVPTTVDQVHSTNDYWWYLLRQTIPQAATDDLLQFSAATPLGDQDFPKLTDMIRSGQRRVQQQQQQQLEQQLEQQQK
jgi:hypothetical protein